MKKILLIICMAAISYTMHAQDTLNIRTTAVCKTCKKTIEHDLSFAKGVKKATLDLDSKIISVVYDAEKTTPEKIREAVTKTGYGADSLAADPKARKRLPDCCRLDESH